MGHIEGTEQISRKWVMRFISKTDHRQTDRQTEKETSRQTDIQTYNLEL